MDIGPGDFVECVSVSPKPTAAVANIKDLAKLRVGAVYQVTEVFTPASVALRGVTTAAPCGYYVDRFRPVYRPKADLIEALLTPVDMA